MVLADTGAPKDGAAALLELWSEFVAQARDNVLNPNPALLPPLTPLEYPALPMGTTALPPTLRCRAVHATRPTTRTTRIDTSSRVTAIPSPS